jgi:adenosylcobinamide-phosphate synthase
MTFLSILCALLIEQIKPLRADNPVYNAVNALAVQLEAWFNAGKVEHGKLGWFTMMAALTLPTLLVYLACAHFSPVAALVWNILIVYLTLGFRHYTDTARRLLTEWTKQDASALDIGEISRLAVEKALITTHRHVFGVFFWFLMPLGPAGAVLYRVAEYLARAWNEPDHLRNEAFGEFAARAYYWIDWIPARLTAAAFAVVGNFEDAVYAWRNFAHRWQNETTGIILSAGGGAMGVRLGTPVENVVTSVVVDAAALDAGVIDIMAPEVDTAPGEEATTRALQSTVGLVWRALLLWMLLLLLLSLAVWLG